MSRFEDLFPGGQSIHQEGLAIINFTDTNGNRNPPTASCSSHLRKFKNSHGGKLAKKWMLVNRLMAKMQIPQMVLR